MGKAQRLVRMIDDRGIGIVMLQLKGPRQTVCGGVPSPMGGRQVPHMGQGRRKAYAARCLLSSSTHQRFRSPAVPGPEVELGGVVTH